MSEPGKPRPLSLEPFDPLPLIAVALQLLEKAGVRYALAGRLGIWAWVPAGAQEFAKDVDFAVPEVELAEVERAARASGFEPLALSIGGFAIRTGQTRIDFIDRRVDFGPLYTEAVEAAHRLETSTSTTDGRSIPLVPAEYLAAMKLATGDPRDERYVERLLVQDHFDYAQGRRIVRQHLGPAVANRMDHVGARVGQEEAARYVRASNGNGD